MNRPYRVFLKDALDSYSRALRDARTITEPLGIPFGEDTQFPWRDDFRDAVGRCGPGEEGDLFVISIHYRAIYRCLLEDPFLQDSQWEAEAETCVRQTVMHEVGHGIYSHFLDLTAEDDNLWDWCVKEGFDRTLFRDGCDSPSHQEDIAEEFATEGEDSLLYRFIEKFKKEYQ